MGSAIAPRNGRTLVILWRTNKALLSPEREPSESDSPLVGVVSHRAAAADNRHGPPVLRPAGDVVANRNGALLAIGERP